MDNTLFPYSPLTEREPLHWPDGARIAFYVGLNVEHFEIDRPATSIYPGTAGLSPDPLNFGWRDYGPRVGIWRVADILDKHGIRASVMLNSDVVDRYPQIIEAGRQRDWAWIAHGKNNNILQAGMEPDEERAYLTEVVETIERGTGRRPRGWLGPGLTETYETPRLLAGLGLDYVLDWGNDDQPYPLAVDGMFSVPYAVELGDIQMFVGKSLSGPEYVRIVKDQFDQLLKEAEESGSGRVMPLVLHPFVIGQAFRAKYLDEALEYIAGHPATWLTTSDEIAAHYARTAASAAPGPAAG
ncbi:polysaccharide deacetylase family protein [Streptomyces albus subsp. chlorinus]|uniref:polysaccharide deacetylase family protein n=1 Tax=Streptomyces albus TaxID=1888 RepID=UPI001571581E|nr:polysaccharide deacetylase family protein [Streptomyces albus]NSC24036.1 polysaccharide deacetylase family protein [Streptomyces albus subsp. chlorinus]